MFLLTFSISLQVVYILSAINCQSLIGYIINR